MLREGKLWELTDEDCRIVSHTTSKGAITVSAPNTPAMFWPDGSVCWPVTMWLTLKQREYLGLPSKKGIRNFKAGTTVTNASLISQLIRFTFEARKKKFHLLTDDDIKAWIHELVNEKHQNNNTCKMRSIKHVGRIVRTGLTFLVWYQRTLLPNEDLIGFEISHQITIESKSGLNMQKNFKAFSFDYFHHRYIPIGGVSEDVKPIGHANITRLYSALRNITKDIALRKRDESILRLLEATGGRRVEIAQLTKSDLLEAYENQTITLLTAKNSMRNRKIPISKEWIEPIIMYIKTYRVKTIKKLIKLGKIDSDPNSLFINTRNGEPLSEEWITKLISRLRLAAGINEKTCAHMFRHRFITIQVATRLKEYNKGDLPLDVVHTILTKVAAISGHSDPKSLSNYIDLAFEELGAWDTSDKVLQMRSKLEGAYRQIQTIKYDMKENSLSSIDVINQLDRLLIDMINAADY